jgi:hypothetical protein
MVFLGSMSAATAWSLLRRRRGQSMPATTTATGIGEARDAPSANATDSARSDASLYLILSAVALALTLLAMLLLDGCRPATDVSLDAVLPSPGKWVTVSGATRDKGRPPIDAEFRAFSLRDQGTSPTGGERLTLDLRISVSSANCAMLEADFGGNCGDGAGRPLRNPESLVVQSEAALVWGTVQPAGPTLVQLSHSGTAGGESPTEWSFASHAKVTKTVLECAATTPILIAVPGKSARVDCAPDEAFFHLRVIRDGTTLPTYHLNGVHSMVTHLRGAVGGATIDEGTLRIAGESSDVGGAHPERIDIHADPDHVVTHLAAPAEESIAHLSIRSSQASEISGHQLPSLLDPHRRWMDIVLGVLVTAFAGALFTFAFTRLKSK